MKAVTRSVRDKLPAMSPPKAKPQGFAVRDKSFPNGVISGSRQALPTEGQADNRPPHTVK